jgi:anti-anti-sigma factor
MLMLWNAMTPRVHGDVLVIDLDGKMCLYDEDELLSYVVTLLEQGFLKFVLNFARVRHIDSMTLGETVRAYTTVARRGGKVVLLHLPSRIRAVLDREGLGGVIERFDSEEDALRSFDRLPSRNAPNIQPQSWHRRVEAGRRPLRPDP